MKNWLILPLLFLGAIATGAERMSLETKIVTPDGAESSLYKDQSGVSLSIWGGINEGFVRSEKITFYVDAQKLYGAEKLDSGSRYRLDSISWQGHRDGRHTGGSRVVIVKAGDETWKSSIPESQSNIVTVRQKKSGEEEGFTFSPEDVLEVTLTSNTPGEYVYLKYYDGPEAPGEIRGVSFKLDEGGQVEDSAIKANIHNAAWRYNSPAIRLRVTEVEGGVFAIQLLAGLLGIILAGAIIVLFRKKKQQ